jgi:hypothetical protein
LKYSISNLIVHIIVGITKEQKINEHQLSKVYLYEVVYSKCYDVTEQGRLTN